MFVSNMHDFLFVFIPIMRVVEHAWNGEELGLMKVFYHMTFESHEHCLHRTTLRQHLSKPGPRLIQNSGGCILEQRHRVLALEFGSSPGSGGLFVLRIYFIHVPDLFLGRVHV